MKFFLYFAMLLTSLQAQDCLTASTFIEPWQGGEAFGNKVAFEKAQAAFTVNDIKGTLAHLEIASEGSLSAEVRARLDFYSAILQFCQGDYTAASMHGKSILSNSEDDALRAQVNAILSHITPKMLLAETKYKEFELNPSLNLAVQIDSLASVKQPFHSKIRAWVSFKQDSILKICKEFPPRCSTYFQYWPANENRFAGIGLALVQQQDGGLGLYPLPGSPAEKAGIPLGSTLLSINDSVNLSLAAVSRILKTGAVGDSVKLAVEFQSDTLEGSIDRVPMDLSRLAPLDSEIILRIYNGMEDTIACLDGCKRIILASDSTLTISAGSLAEFDYALTPAQAAAFSQEEIQYVKDQHSSRKRGQGLIVLGSVGILGGAIAIATDNSILGFTSFAIGFVSLIAGGNSLGNFDTDLSGFILEHNQRLKRPGHKPAGKTKSIFSDPEKSKSK